MLLLVLKLQVGVVVFQTEFCGWHISYMLQCTLLLLLFNHPCVQLSTQLLAEGGERAEKEENPEEVYASMQIQLNNMVLSFCFFVPPYVVPMVHVSNALIPTEDDFRTTSSYRFSWSVANFAHEILILGRYLPDIYQEDAGTPRLPETNTCLMVRIINIRSPADSRVEYFNTAISTTRFIRIQIRRGLSEQLALEENWKIQPASELT